MRRTIKAKFVSFIYFDLNFRAFPLALSYIDTAQHISLSDLDECATNSSLCHQVCTNTFGSYECGCYPGFRLFENSSMCEGKFILSYRDTLNCKLCFLDINECENANRTCEQNCTNEVGSFICSCEAGFSLDENNKTCTRKHS